MFDIMNSGPKTKSDIAYEQLKDLIIHGKIDKTTPLVERHLCEQLHTSRTPIREAIQRLAADGLVTYIPSKGALVTEIRYEDIVQIYDVREYLERLAGKLCIGVSTILPDIIEELTMYSEQMNQALLDGDFTNFYANDMAFHKALIHASKNNYLIRAYNSIIAQIERITHLIVSLPCEQLQATNHYHYEVLEAIKARDISKIDRAISEHTQACKNGYLQYFSPYLHQTISGKRFTPVRFKT